MEQNKSVLEIETMFKEYKHLEEMLRESMHDYLSRVLMDTSEDKPLEKHIYLSNIEGFGISILNFPLIYSMWQRPTEGLIYFAFEQNNSLTIEFNFMLTEDLLTICKHIEEDI